MEWSYYDFVSDFHIFKAAWDTPSVQNQLEKDLQQYCVDHELPLWTRGDPVWSVYDGVGSWKWMIEQMALYTVKDMLRDEANVVKSYQASMRRACGKSFRNPEKAFVDLVSSRLIIEHSPKPETYKSLVTLGLGHLLTESLLKTAIVLYPEEFIEIRSMGPHDAVVLPNRGLVLDILGFFSWKELRDPDFAPENLYYPDSEDEEEGEVDELGYVSQEEMLHEYKCTCWECSSCDDLGEPGLF